MIFPEHCKHVGHASTKPCDERVYFLSRWLLRDTPGGHEVLEVTLDQTRKGMMRPVLSSRVLATESEVYHYPEKVNLHNRTRLVELALDSGCRCTVFTSHDEHQTFVLDPDLSGFLKIHVYDVSPPRPSLSSCIHELENAGLFGLLTVQFCHHIRDITEVSADVYPCRAAGFEKTLDEDTMQGGEKVAGCLTAAQFYTECYGKDFHLVNICPLECVREEPFIARCCRGEREGPGSWNGKSGAVVHWGADPGNIYAAVRDLVSRWREK
ncbi:MAG TPA: hypothetical protein P5013_04340 [Methanoregula sp.]|nr:hypothetical protein [Methanoregula sp.]